jgi:hypothetical protein
MSGKRKGGGVESTQIRIRWAPRLRPALLKRLYDSDAKGFQNLELCEEVGSALYARCDTFHLVSQTFVRCPICFQVFEVAREGVTTCLTKGCAFNTTFDAYGQSVQNYYAWTGRAAEAFETFYQRYPTARTYREKMLLIDQLIHSFHIDEKRGVASKSVASKLLEGNRKEVVRFLDELSGVDTESKDEWRRTTANTIDGHVLKSRP